jgi:hypothetical protein
MDDTSGRMVRLERSVKRLHGAVLALGGVAMLGAASTPQELTLRELTIVDEAGEDRFVITTAPDGTAVFAAFDRDGKQRFGIGTLPHGRAIISAHDRDEEIVWSKGSP